MGGQFDWRGLNAAAENLGSVRERDLARKQQDEEFKLRKTQIDLENKRRQDAIDEQNRRKRLEAAAAQYDAVKHLPEDDERVQSSLQQLETAERDFYGAPVTRPRKTVETPSPAPAPGQLDESGQQIGTSVALPQQKELITSPAQVKQYDPAHIQQGVQQHIMRINAASSNPRNKTERELAIAAAQQYRDDILKNAPQYADLVPDFAAIGQKFVNEANANLQAAQAATDDKTWRAGAQQLRTRLAEARKGSDIEAYAQAIADWNAHIAAGKEAGHTKSGAVDPKQALISWIQSPHHTPEVLARFPESLQKFLTPSQRKLVDLYLQQQGHRAAGGKGSGKAKKTVEETGF